MNNRRAVIAEEMQRWLKNSAEVGNQSERSPEGKQILPKNSERCEEAVVGQATAYEMGVIKSFRVSKGKGEFIKPGISGTCLQTLGSAGIIPFDSHISPNGEIFITLIL